MTSTTNRMTMKISSTMKTKNIITFSLQQSKKFYSVYLIKKDTQKMLELLIEFFTTFKKLKKCYIGLHARSCLFLSFSF